jgi:poly-gamma-glutamate capsule biosynthesis protein CapA/YwtB (metallophosphatase superfamily)
LIDGRSLGTPAFSRRVLLRLSALLTAGALAGKARLGAAGERATGVEMTINASKARGSVTLFLCGDVMTGRGIDQILAHPVNPALYEPYVTSAVEYLELAEAANGPIPRPVDPAYIWGEALTELDRRKPDLRIINLETGITRSEDAAPKGINYRMAPENASCLTAAGIDCCVLANNHVLDWGPDGLADTLETLEGLDIRTAGAGRDTAAAEAPAILSLAGQGQVLVFGFGVSSSGIPRSWAARRDRPGVDLLNGLSDRTLDRIAARVKEIKRAGDIVVGSIHWGGNWGYEIANEERDFAHGLIEVAGIDIVHGHSSHHAKAVEVHRGKLVLYGCGDFLNDYEGIAGYEAFRDDLTVMYLPTVAVSDGGLARLELVPFRIRNFTLRRAPREDATWLRDVLTREGKRFGTSLEMTETGTLNLLWQ